MNPLEHHDLMFTGTGQLIVTHVEDDCVPPCAIHAPSEHHMREWPLHWRGDKRILERVCPHGTGHPDPDDLATRIYPILTVHGCDNCCQVPSTTTSDEEQA